MAIGQLISRVVGFFVEPDKAAGRAPPEVAAANATSTESADFERNLLDGAEQAPSVPVVMIRVLGVEQARRALGRKWDAVSHHVIKLADVMIQSHLNGDDRHTSVSADCFLIYFAGSSPDDASRRAGEIGVELVNLLLSVLPSGTGLSVAASLVEVATDEGAPAAEVKQATPPTPIDITNAPPPLPEDPPTTAESEAEKSAEPPCEAPDNPAAREALDSLKSQPTVQMDSEAVQRVQQKAATLFNNIKVGYRPVWQAGRHRENRIQSILMKDQDGELEFGEALYPRNDAGILASDQDMILALAVIAESQKIAQERANRRLVLPIHFGVLTIAENRDQLASLTEGLNDDMRARILIEVVCFGTSYTTALLPDVMSFARRLPGQLCAFLRPDPVNINGMENLGFESLWTTASDAQPKALAAFASYAKRIGARPGLHDVDEMETFEIAQRSGFELMTGNAVGPPSAESGDVV